jgi:hypothetical protein
LLNQDSATGIYKTMAETQRGFCQTFELRPRSDCMTIFGLFLEREGHSFSMSLK